MDNSDGRRDEAVELEEGRASGPRWAELDEEASRTQRVDLAALWCRRLAGLLVWIFVGFIFSKLWQAAWEEKDLKLMGVCLLVTLSLVYALVKRYQHMRETGLTGIELVRALATDALAVDQNGGVRLRGVTQKARAMCVDFKYDPGGTFREKSAGRGFELYPRPAPAPPGQPSDLSPASPSSTTPISMSAMGADGAEAKDEDEERGRGGGATAGWSKNRPRRRGKWPWAWRRGEGGRTPTDQGDGDTGYAEAKADEESPTTPIAREEEEGRAGGGGRDRQETKPPSPSRPLAASPRGSGGGGGGGSGGGAFLGGMVGQPRPAPTPQSPPGFEPSGPGGEEEGGRLRRRQVIHASELSASCSVCLYDYYPDEAVTLLPCSHLYHTECIDIWMRDHVDCPYCRADMNVWCNDGGASAISRAGAGATAGGAAASAAN